MRKLIYKDGMIKVDLKGFFKGKFEGIV